MITADIIALFAILISLISFWLSYRTTRLNKQLAAAEKRTQSHTVLFGVWIDAKELRSLVCTAMKGDCQLPEGIVEIEAQLSDIIENLEKRLAWLQTRASDDPLLLEEYKLYAKQAEALIKQVGPMIKGLEIKLNT